MMETARDQGGIVPTDQPRYRRVIGHPLILAACLLGAVVLIWLFDRFLPDQAAVILIDRERSTFPLTVQNVMWLVFALGIGELIVRVRDALAERAELRLGYLPEDETTILQTPELRRIYAAARAANGGPARSGRRFLPRMILRVVTQFQTN